LIIGGFENLIFFVSAIFKKKKKKKNCLIPMKISQSFLGSKDDYSVCSKIRVLGQTLCTGL
jgi:hypothetical protein